VGKASLFERLGFVAGQPMSLELFREQVIEVLRLEQPGAIIERRNRDEIEVRWERDPHGPLTFSVDETYALYLRSPRELIAAIQHAALFILITSVTPTLEALTVLIQASGYNPDANPAYPALTRPIVDELLAVVVIDNIYGYQFLAAASLREALGLDDAALWERALQNTIARLQVEDTPQRPGEAKVLLRGDGLATSLLLVDEFWDPPRQSEALVVAPVAPNKIAVAPARDGRALRVLRQMMKSDPLSREWRQFKGLLARRQGRWEVVR
jgi:hypothetical protein